MIVFELVFVREEILVEFITVRRALMVPGAHVIVVQSVLVGPVLLVVTVVTILRWKRIRREL